MRKRLISYAFCGYAAFAIPRNYDEGCNLSQYLMSVLNRLFYNFAFLSCIRGYNGKEIQQNEII